MQKHHPDNFSAFAVVPLLVSKETSGSLSIILALWPQTQTQKQTYHVSFGLSLPSTSPAAFSCTGAPNADTENYLNSTKFVSLPQNSCGQSVSSCTGLSDISPGPIFPEQMVPYGTSCLEEEAFQIEVYMNSMSSSAKCAFLMPVDKFSACLFDDFSWGLQKNGLEMEHLQRSGCWQKKALQWDVKYVHCNLYRQLASGKLDLWPVEDRNISKETTEAVTGTRWDRDGGTNYIFTAVTPMLKVCWWQMTLWWTSQ